MVCVPASAHSGAAGQAAPIQHSISCRQQRHRVLGVMVATEVKVLGVSHGHAHTRGCAALIAGVREWAAPRFPDGRIAAISCRELPVQALSEGLLRSPVSECRMETYLIVP